jgi:hypothetical protein
MSNMDDFERIINNPAEFGEAMNKARGVLLDLVELRKANAAMAWELDRLRAFVDSLGVIRDPSGESRPEPAPAPVAAAAEAASGGPGAEPPACPIGMDPRTCESCQHNASEYHCDPAKCGNAALFYRGVRR